MRKKALQKGMALVEILVGISIIGLVFVFVSFTIVLFLNSSDFALEQTKALYLAEEGQELIKYLRDENWSNIEGLTEGSTYYFSLSTTTIDTTNQPEVIDGVYTRSVVVDELRRNASNDFVESGGSVDDNGRVVTVTVVWSGHSLELKTILANLYNQ